MWYLKTTVICTIIAAMSTIQNYADKNNKIPGSPCLQEIQKMYCLYTKKIIINVANKYIVHAKYHWASEFLKAECIYHALLGPGQG